MTVIQDQIFEYDRFILHTFRMEEKCKIGKYKVQMIDAGRYKLDGGAMFGVVPRTLWQKENPADEKNRIQIH